MPSTPYTKHNRRSNTWSVYAWVTNTQYASLTNKPLELPPEKVRRRVVAKVRHETDALNIAKKVSKWLTNN